MRTHAQRQPIQVHLLDRDHAPWHRAYRLQSLLTDSELDITAFHITEIPFDRR